MKGTKRAQLEARRDPGPLTVENVAPGDTVEFFGLGSGDGVGGFKTGTVTKVYPRLQVLRVEKKVVAEGIKEFLAWRTTIHESRLLRNLSRPPEAG